MKVLVINCRNASMTFELYEMETEKPLVKGVCKRIGSKFGHLRYEPTNAGRLERDVDLPDHDAAMKIIVETMISPNHGVISDINEIDVIGHRIVHGGDKFKKAALLNKKALSDIEALTELAPFHNPLNLKGIYACQKYLPGIPMVGVFSTAFHQTMPEEAYLYGIPYDYYKKYKIRRYGFHGISYDFVARRAAKIMDVPYDRCKQIICHLGDGASVCAIKNGKSIDTSMGYTPLEGVIMETRSGSIDPEILNVISKKEDLNMEEVIDTINTKSGVYGLSNFLSSNIQDISDAYGKNDPNAIRAMHAYTYSIAKYIGAYATVLEGVDAITFTGEVGEHSALVRKLVCDHLKYFGIVINDVRNVTMKKEAQISLPESAIRVYVIPIDEQLAIARQTAELYSTL